MDASAGFSGSSALVSTLISSLGETTLDAFYFACAYASLDEIRALSCSKEATKQHWVLGLKAAWIAGRADVGKLMVDHGADVDSFAATIGLADTQAFIVRGYDELKLQNGDEQLPVHLPARNVTLREANVLHLRWAELRPKSRIAFAAVEGVENPRHPRILHLVALGWGSFSSAHRKAWMQFDLERGADIDGYADNRHVFGAPLHWVLHDGADVWENREVLTFLIERGADPFNTCPGEPYTNVTPRQYIKEDCRVSEQSDKAQEFYAFATAELLRAEQAWTARTSIIARLKNAIGLKR